MIHTLRSLRQLLNRNYQPEKEVILVASSLARANRQLSSIHDFAEVEFSAFSQWGEDGIIDWLVTKLTTVPRIFVEFGVENYREANTRLLAQLHNWRGLVMDGSRENIGDLRAQDISWRYQLDSAVSFVTRENINDSISAAGLEGEIGLLSIDIDGNDYWVWQAITHVSPAIVVIEYNAVFGDLNSVTVPYRADFRRTKAHRSNLYFGASLPALIALGKEKGYTFLGTNSSGVNAFFIRNDLAHLVVGCIQRISAYPSLFREARGHEGELLFLSGEERSMLISELPLIDIVTGEQTSLRDIGEIFSEEWNDGRGREL